MDYNIIIFKKIMLECFRLFLQELLLLIFNNNVSRYIGRIVIIMFLGILVGLLL